MLIADRISSNKEGSSLPLKVQYIQEHIDIIQLGSYIRVIETYRPLSDVYIIPEKLIFPELFTSMLSESEGVANLERDWLFYILTEYV